VEKNSVALTITAQWKNRKLKLCFCQARILPSHVTVCVAFCPLELSVILLFRNIIQPFRFCKLSLLLSAMVVPVLFGQKRHSFTKIIGIIDLSYFVRLIKRMKSFASLAPPTSQTFL
jgi:hypothetical protein